MLEDVRRNVLGLVEAGMASMSGKLSPQKARDVRPQLGARPSRDGASETPAGALEEQHRRLPLPLGQVVRRHQVHRLRRPEPAPVCEQHAPEAVPVGER